MAFTTVPDKASGDTISLANWNTHIRDNLNTGLWRPVADSLLLVDTASVTFSSISATTHENLLLLVYARGSNASANVTVSLRLNADSGANYDSQLLEAAATTVSGTEARAATSIAVAKIPANTATANVFGGCVLSIPNYHGTTLMKAVRSRYAHKQGITTGLVTVGACAGFWRSAAAISSLTVLPTAGNFKAGSRFTLLGASV